ncbi:hypothetical protein [Rhodobaculum claviforme]|uniref:Uncharacterized protein n=1 Tax=Rhodobaculum claviforme TaxID=1549854 RepID=A0A934TMX4_9RHOB|nr:hypothetical protein [Rhodobaculum claviforme]MBK5928436.1 hypothetical protein [Rhodobaculum claviforme]
MTDAQQGACRVLVVAEGGGGDGLAGLAEAFSPVLTLVPATLAQAARDDAAAPVLCLSPAPEVAVARALARGATLEAALEGWRAEAEALLAGVRPLRRRLTLVLIGDAPPAPEVLAGVLGPRLGRVPEPVTEDGAARAPVPDGRPASDTPRALLVLIAAAGLAADPGARALLAEISATAVPLSQGQDTPCALRGLVELRALMADGGVKADLNRQIAAMAEEIAQLDAALGAARADCNRGAAETARARAEVTAADQQAAQLTAALDTARSQLAQAQAERDDARADADAEAAARAGQADRLGALEADRARAQAARATAEQAAAAALAQAEALRGDLARREREGTRQGWRDAVLGQEILRLSRALRAQQAQAGPAPDDGEDPDPAPDPLPIPAASPAPAAAAASDASVPADPAASSAPGRGKRPAADRKATGAGRQRGGDSRG